eukprot:UN23678
MLTSVLSIKKKLKSLKSKTETGEYTAMSISDYLRYLKFFSSWEEIVVKHHYSFTETPSLGVKNTHWVSLFGLAQDYNEYYLQTQVPMLEDPQRSTWHKAIPASIDYMFTEPRKTQKLTCIFLPWKIGILQYVPFEKRLSSVNKTTSVWQTLIAILGEI